ncbi:hypothetical protein ACHAXN_000595 [Cyclotella atomus]
MHWHLSASNTREDAAIVVNMGIKVEIAGTIELAFIVERRDTSDQTVKSNAKQMQFAKRKQYVLLTKQVMKKRKVLRVI